MKRVHAMPFGAAVLEDGGVRFRLWAPSVVRVTLELARGESWQAHAMQRADGGWHEITLPHAMAGDRYRYRMPDGLRVPDPASRRNPDDVHGPSEVVDPLAHAWTDPTWTGIFRICPDALDFTSTRSIGSTVPVASTVMVMSLRSTVS